MYQTIQRRCVKWCHEMTLKRAVLILAGVIFVILLFTEYSPLDALRRFFVNLVSIVDEDFKLSISRDINDCFFVLWTRKNPTKQQIIKNISVEALGQTHFNKYAN